MTMVNKDLEKAMYRWFDMKYELYSRLNHNDSIYLYYDGAEYAEVRIDKKYKKIHFNRWIWLEFSEIFPMEYNEFKEFISKWVGDTFNLKGFTPGQTVHFLGSMLKIPK